MEARTDRQPRKRRVILQWYRADHDLLRHPKTADLMHAGCWTKTEALGRLHALWGWVSEHAPSGRIEGRSVGHLEWFMRERQLEYEARLSVLANSGDMRDGCPVETMKYAPQSDLGCLACFVQTGFIEEHPDHLIVHNWWDRNGSHLREVERAAERKYEQRKAKRPNAKVQRMSHRDNRRTTAGLRRLDVDVDVDVPTDSQPSAVRPTVESEPARPPAATVLPDERRGQEPNPLLPPPPDRLTIADAISQVCARLQTGPNVEHTAHALAGKIRKHSPWVQPRVVVAIVQFWLERRSTIESPFAYFAKDSEGFILTERKLRLDIEQAEHEANKRAPVPGFISGLAGRMSMTNGSKP